jgi:hypothetical protein
MKQELTAQGEAERIASYRRIFRLPTIETQTLEWFRLDARFGWRSPIGKRLTDCDLARNGFQVYVRGIRRFHEKRNSGFLP